METYTKEQLIDAMTKYNQDFEDNPDKFEDHNDWTNREKSENQVEYMISLI